MSNAKGEVTVQVGGDVVRLYLGFDAQAEVEGICNCTFEDVLLRIQHAELQEKISRRHVRAVLWGAMLRYRPAASLRDASDLVDQLGPEGAGKALEDLLRAGGWIVDDPAEGASGNATPPAEAPAAKKTG